MLYYTEICLRPYEVPGEQSICIYISGCCNKCKNCHYPELQLPDYGDVLSKRMSDIIDLYHSQASCVCFLGEGRECQEEKEELVRLAKSAQQKGLKTCLYCGRDTFIEEWMKGFDYIKMGSYQEELGALDCKTTNQRMYRKTDNGEFEDIRACSVSPRVRTAPSDFSPDEGNFAPPYFRIASKIPEIWRKRCKQDVRGEILNRLLPSYSGVGSCNPPICIFFVQPFHSAAVAAK